MPKRCTIFSWNYDGVIIGAASSNTDHETMRFSAGVYDEDCAGYIAIRHDSEPPSRESMALLVQSVLHGLS